MPGVQTRTRAGSEFIAPPNSSRQDVRFRLKESSDTPPTPRAPAIAGARNLYLPLGNANLGGFHNLAVDSPAGFDFGDDMIGRDFDRRFMGDSFVEIMVK